MGLVAVSGEPTLAQWTAAVGPSPGVLPDGEASGTDVAGWVAALEARGWSATWVRDGGSAACRMEAVFAAPSDTRGFVRVRYPEPGVVVHLWPFDPGTVTFDFDLRELRDARAWAVFASLVRTLSAVTGRDVALFDEGGRSVFARFRARTGTWWLRAGSSEDRDDSGSAAPHGGAEDRGGPRREEGLAADLEAVAGPRISLNRSPCLEAW